MTAIDIRTSQVALVGRVADELTREDLGPSQYRASLGNHRRQAIQKDDGYFVFTDLPASPPDYQVILEGRQYQTRRLTVAATGVSLVEIDASGEDELQVFINNVTGNRVAFDTLQFMRPIPEGAEVIGEAGFTTTLDEPVEGVDVDGAELVDVTGLGPGEALRIVRGNRLLLRPGPYYPFPPGTTVVALRVVDSLPGNTPLEGAQIEITDVNGAAVSTVLVDGVTLFRANLPPPFMIGPLEALGTITNARGDAVFYYPETTPVTSLTLSVTRTGYVTQTLTVTITAGDRTSNVVQLVRA